MLHVSHHPAYLYSTLLLAHAPCLTSFSLAVLRADSHTSVIPHFTLPTRHPLAFSHKHPHLLRSVSRPTPPPCLVSPSTLVVRCAPDTRGVPHLTMFGGVALFFPHLLRPSLSSAWLYSALCVSHMSRASLHPHSLCSPLRLKHALCLASPTLSGLSAATHTRRLSHFTLLGSSAPCV